MKNIDDNIRRIAYICGVMVMVENLDHNNTFHHMAVKLDHSF